MKLYLTALAAATLLFGCKRATLTDKVNESQLKTYFANTILKRPDAVIDTFRLTAVDALTEADGYSYLSGFLHKKLRHKANDLSAANAKYDKYDRLKQQLQGNPFGASLRKVYSDIVEEERDKLGTLLNDINLINADIKMVDSLRDKATSKQPMAYLSKSFYQIKRADFSTERDTAFIVLNKDFNIITLKDYVNNLPHHKLSSGVVIDVEE